MSYPFGGVAIEDLPPAPSAATAAVFPGALNGATYRFTGQQILGQTPAVGVIQPTGTTGDCSGQITLADGGGELYFQAGIFRVAQSITITSEVQIVKGALLRPAAGVTITIRGPFRAWAYTCIDTTEGGIVTISPSANLFALSEWWGGRADGVTDCYAAITAALTCHGICQLFGGVYNTSATIRQNVSGQSLQGANEQISAIVGTFSAGHTIWVGGADNGNGIADYVTGCVLRDVQVTRTVNPTATSTDPANIAAQPCAVRVSGNIRAQINRVTGSQGCVGFYFGRNIDLYWDQLTTARTLISGTPSNDIYVPFVFDGLATDGTVINSNASMIGFRGVGTVTSGWAGANYGLLANGHLSDLQGIELELSGFANGGYIEGTGYAAGDHWQSDLSFTIRLDGYTSQGVTIQGMCSYGMMDFRYYCAPAAGATGWALDLSQLAGRLTFTEGQMIGWTATGAQGINLGQVYGVKITRAVKMVGFTTYVVGAGSYLGTDISPDIMAIDLRSSSLAAISFTYSERTYFQPAIGGLSPVGGTLTGAFASGVSITDEGTNSSKNEVSATMISGGVCTSKVLLAGTAITAPGPCGNGSQLTGVAA